jgi:hypothetical protein
VFFSIAVEEVAISKNKAQLSEAQLGLVFFKDLH